MTERDQSVVYPLYAGNGEPDRLGVYEDFAANENRSADFGPGLVSLGFLTAAVRRRAGALVLLAVVGLVLGLGVYKVSPHKYQATATVLLTLSPYEDSQSAPSNNQAIAETRTVAERAEQALGLSQSASSFLSSYAVVSVTDLVLNVTASAPSSNDAVLRANAVASAFLNFRATELQAEQNLQLQSLDQQISLTKQHLNSIGAQISQLSGQGTSPAQQSQLGRLRAEQTSVTTTLVSLQQAVINNQTVSLPAVTAAVKGSQVLSVAPLVHSRLKTEVTYAAIGLIAGLVLGLSIIIVRALVSDRLGRRDDIAYVLDGPVKLSVGRSLARRRSILPGRAAKRDLDMRRIVAYLQSVVPKRTSGPASLAIVAVDNAPLVAQAVAALATSYASQGNRVVAADLSEGAQMAHLFRVKNQGAHAVSRNGVNFTLTVPDMDAAAPVGPRQTGTSPAAPRPAGDVYASADVLLTLVTLDPALGGDHLVTWAANAVVVISAGQSSAERIHGVGEMVRLAGTRLDSVVLVGADKRDESLGLTTFYSRTTA